MTFINYDREGSRFGNNDIFLVVDSIFVIDDPEKGDDILNEDVSDLLIVRNKDSLKLLGYEQFDAVSFVFTKAYRSRPDSIKMIPSTKSMQKKGRALAFSWHAT
jgi:hypothetical protein